MSAGTYTGRPCSHGHNGERYSNSGDCVICVRERVQDRRNGIKRRYPIAGRHLHEAARLKAVANGRGTFEGWPCAGCQATERYVSEPYPCVACRRRNSQNAAARIKGARIGAHNNNRATYEGRRCKTCAAYRRYTADNKCVACDQRRTAETLEARRSLKQKPKPENWSITAPVAKRPLPDLAVIAVPGITKAMLMGGR